MSLVHLAGLKRKAKLHHVIGTTFGQWILVLSLFLCLQCSGTVLWLLSGGNDEFSTTLNDSWWISYTLLIDIGTQTGFAAHERPTIKIVSVVISLVGFVYCLTLLGMVVDLIREVLDDCRLRYSSVPAQGHWLILGWGDKTLLLVDELLTSMAQTKRGRCGCCKRRQIVILANMPTQQMADEVQVHCMTDPLLQWITSLFFPVVRRFRRFREGSPTDVTELLRVSAPYARDILVSSTSENGPRSDLKAISALLAVAAMPSDSPLTGEVWVEVCQEQSIRAVNTILPQARTIVARKLVNRMMVLRALVPSAGYVYLSLTTLKGDANLHVLPAPSLVCGVSFKELCRFFPDAVVCGVQRAGHQALVPHGSYRIEATDTLVLIARGAEDAQRCLRARRPIAYECKAEPCGSVCTAEPMVMEDGQLRLGPAADGAKVVLLLGCPSDVAEILDIMDVLLAAGSAVHILSRTPAAEREQLIQQHLRNAGRAAFARITVHQYEGESTSKWEMMKLPLETATCALILAERLSEDESTLAIDSRNLTTAILLKQNLTTVGGLGPGTPSRSITRTYTTASKDSTVVRGNRQKCKLVTELLDPKSETVLASNAGVRSQGSYVYTNARETAIYALAVEQREVYNLFEQLSDARCDAGFVTTAPVSHYIDGIEDLSFYEMHDRVFQTCGGVLLGWRDFAERYPQLNPPDKAETLEWADVGGSELIILRPADGSGEVKSAGSPRKQLATEE
ncbi:unnamed protein product [Effrenium voratum]|nr:unnamed protein product [Effrenium voratum]